MSSARGARFDSGPAVHAPKAGFFSSRSYASDAGIAVAGAALFSSASPSPRASSASSMMVERQRREHMEVLERRRQEIERQREESERQMEELERQRREVEEGKYTETDVVARMKYCYKLLEEMMTRFKSMDSMAEGYDASGNVIRGKIHPSYKEENSLYITKSFTCSDVLDRKPYHKIILESCPSLFVSNFTEGFIYIGESSYFYQFLSKYPEARYTGRMPNFFQYVPKYLLSEHSTMRPHIEFMRRPWHKYVACNKLMEMLCKMTEKYYIVGYCNERKLEFIEKSIMEMQE